MPPTKKNADDKSKLRPQGEQQQRHPMASTSSDMTFPRGTEDNAQLRAHLHIPATSDTRGPPQALQLTAHNEPTRDAARNIGPEPDFIHSAATLIPHLLPPSRNGIYPTMMVNDFYESIAVSTNPRQLPPVPKVPMRTQDLRHAFFELNEDYRTLAMPSISIQRQPRRQTYFLQRDDLSLCDYIIEIRNHNMPPLRRYYNSQMTLANPAALAGIQHQSDVAVGYNRLKRTDYCALAQVIVQSDIAGYEYFPLQQLSMLATRICFEYVTLHNGLAFWSLPLSIRPTVPVAYKTATYDNTIEPKLYPQEHAVPNRVQPRKPITCLLYTSPSPRD